MRSVVISLFASLTLVGCGAGDDKLDPTTIEHSGVDSAPAEDTGPSPTDTGTTTDAPLDVSTETGPSCTAARKTALKPVEKVSTGEVKTLENKGDVKTLYVDASAGGSAAASTNPWTYLDLSTATRVDITDSASLTASTWDLAIKRPVLRTNSGDSGPAGGGAVFLKGKAFDAVTDAEVKSALPAAEDWFDHMCTLKTDPTGAIKTTFDRWYEYDGATMKLTPAAGTWIVRGAKGALYRLEIGSYYANPDGTLGATSARYKLRVAAVK